ncbi:hypothetical protein NUW58_g3126 [Xylaria curta]|uniref:Uncharacterized protein n=1 Tax=Xylaria curta TaxID=42375 RepID=A0ACC1PCE7_9PEZI|nr:hypothetical protein NUW58_g3126 [Xylaria curta]
MGKDSSSAYKGKSHDKKPYTGKSGFHKLLGTGSKSDRSSEKSSGASSISTGFSFLFVVNELVLRQDARPNVDQWGRRDL